MKLNPGEKIREDHFGETFIFPDDLVFLGDICKTPFLCDVFNEMVAKRMYTHETTETLTAVKSSGKNGVKSSLVYDLKTQLYKKC